VLNRAVIHHPKNQSTKADASFKAEQDKRRKEQALANAKY
jgi:ParB family chromosome partitioning protein